jgi:hypothetical protein
MAFSLPDQDTIVPAWLNAISHLEKERNVFDLSFTVENPQIVTGADSLAIESHDRFLRRHDSSISTVANTIFPRRLYRMHGYPGVFEHFDNVQGRLKESGSWGSYFQRLAGGKHSGTRPLELIVTKMRNQLAKGNQVFSRIYEWGAPLYDPALDCERVVRQPCMSHISFKLVGQESLRVTAIYRSHYYNAKLLGNLIGLRDLQRFLCEQVEVEPGPLTIFSTYATFDHDAWTITEAKQMVANARDAYAKGGVHVGSIAN